LEYNQIDLPEQLRRLAKAGGAKFKKKLTTKAAKDGGVDIAWADEHEYTFYAPERSYFNHKGTAEPYPLRGSVDIIGGEVGIEPPAGQGFEPIPLHWLIKTILLGGKAADPEEMLQSEFDRRYYEFVAAHCDLASVDLDETFYAARRPQDPERNFLIGESVDELIAKLGLKPGSGFLSATTRARNAPLADLAFRELPADAWARKLIDPFSKVIDA
jgi:hypothetical protein